MLPHCPPDRSRLADVPDRCAVFGATLLADAGVTGGPSDIDLAGTVSVTG
ncbi:MULTISPECIES: hypothetical protein [unclassified Curtobacterium]|nr:MULTISPECIES: hypothetical protein [unclassified Curtobacterium]